MKRLALMGLLGLLLSTSTSAAAIVIDGDFSDWDAVAAVATSIDNGITDSADFAQLKVTHDASYVYLYYSLHRAVNPQTTGGGGGVYLAIDSDDNAATGFDIFGLGLVGSEAGWQNNYPFEQATGNFNTGAGLTNATYAATPYYAVTSAVEISLPRTAFRNSGGNVFPADGGTIGLMFYTTASTDYIEGSYTFVIPEPASLGLLALAAPLLLRKR